MKKISILVFAGLLVGSCDGSIRQSGWFLGGKERRVVETPNNASVDAPSPSQVDKSNAERDPQVSTKTDTIPSVRPASPEAPKSHEFLPPLTTSGLEDKIGNSTTTPDPNAHRRAVELPGTDTFIAPDTGRTKAASTTSGGTVTLNFVDADIRDVVKTVLGGTLGQNFVIDPNIKGNITLQTTRAIPRRDVYATLESALRLNGLALVNVDGLYSVVPAASAGRQGRPPSIAGLTNSRGFGFGIDIVPLQYAAASELARILQPLAPPEAVLRVDTTRNILFVSGTQQERRAINEIIAIFDVDWLSGMSFAMVPLENANPKEAIIDLERVFGTAKGGPLAGLVRFFPVERRSSILVITSRADYIEKAKSWIARLDVGGSDQKRLYVYSVENARATDLAAILSQVFSDGAGAPSLPSGTTTPGQSQARLTSRPNSVNSASPSSKDTPTVNARTLGPILNAAQATEAAPANQRRSAGNIPEQNEAANADLPDELTARIIPDDINNSLVVMARPRVWRMIEDALAKLDVVPLQVMIEATIAEVTLNDDLRYGVQSFFNSGNSQLNLSTGATAALNATFPGFSYIFQPNSDIRVVLDALDSITDIRVISSPQVLVLDNRTAELQVGDQVPISTQQSISNTDPNAPTVNQIEFRDTGVVLRVTPRVNASGVVNLEIEQEESSAVQTNTSGIDSPTIQQRRLRSSVVVSSGETIALGGLIRETLTDAVSGLPILSSIPILGNLFSSTTESGRRTELLVLITPRVIRNQEEARGVTRDLKKTLHNAAAVYKAGPTRR